MESVLYKRHPEHDFLFCGNNGYVFSLKSSKFLTRRNRENRPYVRINPTKSVFVHRLIWETFVGEIEPSLVINHIDGSRDNNELSNLEMITHKENINHVVLVGLFKDRSGTKNANCKITEKDAMEIIKRFSENSKELAVEFGISSAMVRAIRNGRSWKHLPRV